MLKIAKTAEAVHTHTHTQVYLNKKEEKAYKICFNSNVNKTDQL